MRVLYSDMGMCQIDEAGVVPFLAFVRCNTQSGRFGGFGQGACIIRHIRQAIVAGVHDQDGVAAPDALIGLPGSAAWRRRWGRCMISIRVCFNLSYFPAACNLLARTA